MFAVVYRWRVKPGQEDAFLDGWERVTRAVHAHCGSYGSRLHRAGDGTWLAYARWPDAATRSRCEHPEQEGGRMMADAADLIDETTLDIVSDLLDERGLRT